MWPDKSKKHILHLPKWYPYPDNPQFGVFVLKQIEAVAGDYKTSVLFINPVSGLKSRYRLSHTYKNEVFAVFAEFRQYSGNNSFVKHIVHCCRYFKIFRKGKKIIINHYGAPDLIHSHVLLRAGVWGLFYKILKKIPYVVSEHWSGYITGKFAKKGYLYCFLSRKVLNNAFRVLVVSEKLGDAIVDSGIKPEKISVVPNIVYFPEHRVNSSKPESSKIIALSVADLVESVKNLGDVIRVIAGISSDISLEYHIIGDGEDRQKLEQLAENLGVLNKVVFFHGIKTNDYVYDFLNKTDFVIINSNIETFSVIAAEALACGKPVIATKCGGPETFINEKNGILIEPGNKEQLQDAILQMIESYKNYEPDILINTVKEKFSREKIRKLLNEIYQDASI